MRTAGQHSCKQTHRHASEILVHFMMQPGRVLSNASSQEDFWLLRTTYRKSSERAVTQALEVTMHSSLKSLFLIREFNHGKSIHMLHLICPADLQEPESTCIMPSERVNMWKSRILRLFEEHKRSTILIICKWISHFHRGFFNFEAIRA